MALRITALTLVASLLLPFGTIPAAQATTSGTLALPVTGTVAGGGTFAGTFTLVRFVARNDQAFAVGLITGVLTDANGHRRTGLQAPVELPVTLAAGAGGAPAIQNQRGTDRWLDRPVIRFVQATCGILHLVLPGVSINLLGFMVTLDPIVFDISGDTAGPLGNLVCQALELVNNVAGLVGVLNELLGVLGGLTA